MALSNESVARYATAAYKAHQRSRRGLLAFSAKELDALIAAATEVKEQIVADGNEYVRRPEGVEVDAADDDTDTGNREILLDAPDDFDGTRAFPSHPAVDPSVTPNGPGF